mmetsp:Transcript_56226/g.64503  ORF Transcript_56226/g.64503 Transcript_56226/m.64503 type:complete len:131 (+) Transcript_56226:58-450(+)
MKSFMTLFIIAVLFAAVLVSSDSSAEQRKVPADKIIIESDYELQSFKDNNGDRQEEAIQKLHIENDAGDSQNETNQDAGNQSDCVSGNTTNYSRCSNNSTSKSNQILHLNLGSAFIPGMIISFCLMVLFF